MTIEQWRSLPQHYRYAYRQRLSFGLSVEHVFELIGAQGGCHVHLTDYGRAGKRSEHFRARYGGGIEMHYRTADFAGRPDTPPDHDHCPLIKCPCWHDGSSLWVEERIVPTLGESDIDDDAMCYIFRAAAHFADSNFARGGNDE